MKFKEYIQNNLVIADGAIGTYFTQRTNSVIPFCEMANIDQPKVIEAIHKDYIDAGARLITTNTFAANQYSLNSKEKVEEIIRSGLELARLASRDQEIFIASSIGPVPDILNHKEIDREAVFQEYLRMIEIFIEEGAEIFLFETFPSSDFLPALAAYIKGKKPDAYVLCSFAVQPDGYTRKGIHVEALGKSMDHCPDIDGWGFNCCCGPAHMIKLVEDLRLSKKMISMMPNAGYPEIIDQRMVYNSNPDYFARIAASAVSLNLKLLGGCCGTTPEHIRALTQAVLGENGQQANPLRAYKQFNKVQERQINVFQHKLITGQRVIACELDPPFDSNVSKVMDAARVLKEAGVDLITVADSPMARPRMDAVALASKIRRETGIDTMPHLACRDRNINALKSSILAAHMEGIRNILAVTGDCIPETDRGSIKGVFNLNAIRLVDMISQLNQTMFDGDALYISAAANLNVKNPDIELERMKKKVEAGACFFLTQPVFSKESIDYIKQMKKHLPSHVKILVGIMPLVSYRNALFIANEVPGITIPDRYIKLFDPEMDKLQAQETGITLALKIIDEIGDSADGLYLIAPFNRASVITQILDKM